MAAALPVELVINGPNVTCCPSGRVIPMVMLVHTLLCVPLPNGGNWLSPKFIMTIWPTPTGLGVTLRLVCVTIGVCGVGVGVGVTGEER